MPPGAATSSTGVVVNRVIVVPEALRALEAAYRVKVRPGRYWQDPRTGDGGPVRGNLGAASRQRTVRRRGILSTYDKTGLVVIGK